MMSKLFKEGLDDLMKNGGTPVTKEDFMKQVEAKRKKSKQKPKK
jgi:hypothetical protein